MELTAVIAALAYAMNNIAPTTIFTDSKYVVQGITRWVHGWEQNGWQTQNKTPVSHQALWQQLLDLVREREKEAPITWKAIPSHVGIIGNERVDTIATSFAKGDPEDLYRGTLSGYEHTIFPLPDDAFIAEKKAEKRSQGSSSSSSSQKAYSYLSLVDNVLMRHETWNECKARVDGKKAKFRKALSQEHELEICQEWGISCDI